MQPWHIGTQRISADVAIRTTLTVNKSNPPRWHVSASVQVSDLGPMEPKLWEQEIRRTVRDTATELLRGVGMAPDGDKWEVGQNAVHLTRELTMPELNVITGPRA
ncbi:MAG: hypothetical protein NVS3B1_12700 [Marmoricola sp.]